MSDTQPTTETPAAAPAKDETQDPKYGLVLKDVSNQIDDEYKNALRSVRPWRDRMRMFQKLYINQRKNPKKVGDTLMFSTHQTIVAALYQDELSVEWMWREEDDEDRSEMLNALYAFDYDQMGKAQHDYEKYHDTAFFGTSIEDWSYFDRDSLTPIPTLWDPLNTLFDPKATSINGNKMGEGAIRFGGREVLRTKREMQDHGGFFNLDALDVDSKKNQEMQLSQQARDTARGLESQTFNDVKDNKYYVLCQWFTWIDGNRYLVEAGNDRKAIVRLQRVTTDYWPLVATHMYPIPHTPIIGMPGTPDFTEDKQRARAILQNYTLDAAKLDVLPMWLFDKKKIPKKNQLRDWKAGKMIEGENIDANSMFPVTKPTIHQFTQGIMQELETNAQKALATPEIQQGILFQQQRSATEINHAQSGVDTRYGLTAKLFTISDANAAYMWLDDYKRHYKDGIDKKMIRVVGPFGPKAEALTADVFRFKADPDVKIESRVISNYKKREQRANMGAFGNLLVATKGSDLRYFTKKMGRLMFSKEEVDRFLPPTIDEMRAEKENDSLSKNSLKGVVIEPNDDHQAHLLIHGKAADSKAKFAHIEAHKMALMMQRDNPQLFAPPGAPPGGPAPTPGAGALPPPNPVQNAIQQLTPK